MTPFGQPVWLESSYKNMCNCVVSTVLLVTWCRLGAKASACTTMSTSRVQPTPPQTNGTLYSTARNNIVVKTGTFTDSYIKLSFMLGAAYTMQQFGISQCIEFQQKQISSFIPHLLKYIDPAWLPLKNERIFDDKQLQLNQSNRVSFVTLIMKLEFICEGPS